MNQFRVLFEGKVKVTNLWFCFLNVNILWYLSLKKKKKLNIFGLWTHFHFLKFIDQKIN